MPICPTRWQVTGRGGNDTEFTKANVTTGALVSLAIPSKKKIKTDHDSLSCYYTNATLLGNKWDELQANVINSNYDVVGITETWFGDNSITSIQNFTSFIKSRGSSKHEGVALYVRSDLEAKETVMDGGGGDCEAVWCQADVDGVNRLVGCVYWPPDWSYDESKKGISNVNWKEAPQRDVDSVAAAGPAGSTRDYTHRLMQELIKSKIASVSFRLG